jgi:predicted RNA methylase
LKVAQEVLQVLQHVDCINHAAVLPGQLDRPMYTKVNKVIELAGGKWNKKAKAHLFDGDAGEALEQVMLTGEIVDKKQELGAFDTPIDIVQMLLMAANIRRGQTFLEPNAGTGAIANAAVTAGAEVYCYEIDPVKSEKLNANPKTPCLTADFLNVTPIRGEPLTNQNAVLFDIVGMNPPFAKRADIHHISHATRFVKKGGVLVAIASAAVSFRDDLLGRGFRTLVEKHDGEITPLPEGSFKSSGTMVNTVMVTMHF